MYHNISYQAKLAPWGTPGIWVGLAKVIHLVPIMYITPRQKNNLTKDMIFLHTSYNKWNKVEKPVMLPLTFEGSDDDEEVEMVPTNINNYINCNVVSDSESDDEVKENLFEEIDDKIEVTLMAKLNPKVVLNMENLQVLYNEDANKEQAAGKMKI